MDQKPGSELLSGLFINPRRHFRTAVIKEDDK